MVDMNLETELYQFRVLKSNLIVTIETFEADDEGALKKINSESFKYSKRDFLRSVTEQFKDGLHHEAEVVYEKPSKINFNKVYLLADGKRVWIFTKSNK